MFVFHDAGNVLLSFVQATIQMWKKTSHYTLWVSEISFHQSVYNQAQN